MAEYVPPQERPVVKIDGPILTPQQEQDKWLMEGIQAVKGKSLELQRCIAEVTAAPVVADRTSGAPEAAAAAASNATLLKATGGFMRVVRAAAALLDELRVEALAPHNYYELYIAVFDEWHHFVQFLQDEHELRKRRLEEMYESVQYVGHILPRLYLLITVGSAYISAGEAPALTLFQDLVEMCKGVQHPTRGLFLRHFLLTMTKNLLPGDMNRARDNNTNADGGTALDTARLLVQNAREMNWLWIRMEARWYGKGVQDAFADKVTPAMAARRTQSDRKELRVLVGMNMVRISQLEGIDVQMYSEVLLPQLMSVITNYREPVAQQYLFEVIVQVFPDEFHLHTLDTLLNTVRYLTVSVDVCEVLRSLMDRLGNYVVALREGRSEVASASEEALVDNMFSIFLEKLEQLPVSYATKPPELREIKRSLSAPPVNPIMLSAYVNAMTSLTRMAVKVSPASSVDNISAVLQCVADKFAAAPTMAQVLQEEWAASQKSAEKALANSSGPTSPSVQTSGSKQPPTPSIPEGADTQPAITKAAITAAEKLITCAMEQVNHLNRVLSMDGLASLANQLPFDGRRAVAMALCEKALSSVGTRKVSSLDGVSRLFELLDPLLCDQEDAPDNPALIYTYNPETEFNEEQETVCRMLHLVDHADPTVYVKMLNGVRKLLGQGGPQRVPRTFPALASLYTRAAVRLYVAFKDAEFAAEEERIAQQAAKYVDSNRGGGATGQMRDDEAEAGAQDGDGADDAGRKEGRTRHTDAGKEKKKKAEADADDDDGGNAGDPKKQAQQLSKQLGKVFKHLHSGDGKGVLEMLAACESTSASAFYAYLTAANAADTSEMTEVAYELYAEVFTLYEEHATSTQDQHAMLVSIINSLYALKHLPSDSYSTLATKACRYCSKLMRKQDQSRMVAQCANLFAKKGDGKQMTQNSGRRKERHRKAGGDGDEEGAGAAAANEKDVPPPAAEANEDAEEDQRGIVVECLERSLKTAKQVANPMQQLSLYVDLLNILLHFFAAKTVQLEARYINDVLDCIRALSEKQREGGGSGGGGEAGGLPAPTEDPGDAADSDSEEEQAIGKQRKAAKKQVTASAAEEPSQDAANGAEVYEEIRQVYRRTTKYIRSRQSVDPRWEEIEV